MDALDSVDGLGVTIGDLTPEGKLKVIFAQIRKNQLSDEFVRELAAKAAAVKAGADAGQADFDKIGRGTTARSSTPTTTRKKP